MLFTHYLFCITFVCREFWSMIAVARLRVEFVPTYKTYRYLVTLLLLLPLLVIYVQLQHNTEQIPGSMLPISRHSSCKPSTRKFIVVTTINYPTESVKKLASLEGWCLIVVGDTKTPEDWAWPNCTYLSLEKQAALGYKTLEHVPENHYSRKNIGYLYAIQQGAEVIYETDDDNLLTGSGIPILKNPELDLFIFPDSDSEFQNSTKNQMCNHVLNIYDYFGHPTIWPRGIPLACLASKLRPPAGVPHTFTTNVSQNGVLAKRCRIGVEQGLANGDPDLDAIFRLTRIPAGEPISILFNPETPIIGLADGTFSPYNSQNTVYHRYIS